MVNNSIQEQWSLDRKTKGNLSIDNEINDDDVCELRWTGYRVLVSAGKTKSKHFNLGSSMDFSLVYPFLTLTCNQDSVCDGVEGLCMLLKRLSYPCRYGDMIVRFVLSMVTNQMIDYVYNTHGHKVLQWNHQVLSPANLQSYVDAITGKGAPLPNCFRFIDGTVRPISRPGEHQRNLYNGHKRVHALKFQSVALPNGLIGNLYGPVGKL